MTQGPTRIRGNKGGQAIVELGPLQTVFDYEDGVRTVTRAIAANKDPTGSLTRSLNGLKTLLWSHYMRKGLELKGLNLRDPEGEQVVFTSVDYRQPYQEAEARIKQLEEENAALREQPGRDRPRPPRPTMN